MPKKSISKTWWFWIYLIIVPTAAHLAFSWLNYAASDDGMMLAMSRRILDGQFPHRDFINKTPVLTPLLHLPVVWLGGAYTYWVSRWIVWVQFALISWLWVEIACRFLKANPPIIYRVLLATAATAFAAHNCPIMAWYTTDGVFFSAVGIFLCLQKIPAVRLCGYGALSLAVLAKQNYLPVPIAAIFLLGDHRDWRAWGAMALPGVVYLAAMAVFGALPDMHLQLTAYSNLQTLYTIGVRKYLMVYALPWGIIIGFAAMGLVAQRPKFRKQLGIALLLFIPLLNAALMAIGSYPSFGLFGVLCGMAAFSLTTPGGGPLVRLCALALLPGWASSISYSYQTPVYGSGSVLAVLGVIAFVLAESPPLRRWVNRGIALIAVAAVVGITFGRFNHPFDVTPAKELTHPLGDVFPGLHGIKGNERTHRVFTDLQRAIALVSPMHYAILPDFPGYWVKSPQPNPLSIDYVICPDYHAARYVGDLCHEKLYERIVGDLERNRGSTAVIVQKIGMAMQNETFMPPLANPRLLAYVREHFMLAGETEFFSIYK